MMQNNTKIRQNEKLVSGLQRAKNSNFGLDLPD